MADAGSTRPVDLRFALYSGLCVRHDAISNGLRLKLDIIERWSASGSASDAVAFVHCSDYEDPRIRQVDGVPSLVRQSKFRAADLHVFEFGIYYPLFDAVFILPECAPVIAFYHNVTPPELADDAAAAAVLERSLVQRHNLSRADHVVTHSDYSREELLNLGFADERVSVIPLPPAHGLLGAPAPASRRGSVELLYVGRFVRAKGVLDLLDVVAGLARRGTAGFRLTLAGNPAFSSPAVVEEVRRRCEGDLSSLVRLVEAPDQHSLGRLYSESDIFVIPSYHEGYCVPVVEALASGCQVVAYDSSNLPFVLGGLGALVPTGDVTALEEALASAIKRFETARTTGGTVSVATSLGDMEEGSWREAVRAHLERCSEAAFEAQFAEVLEAVSDRTRRSFAGARR
jgi:glycosyltransferase involved in cell wall biosynthesis